MTTIPHDDLETEILPLRRRRRLPLVTVLLAFAVVAAAAFAGGVEIQKHYGGTSSSGGAAARLASARAAAATGRAGGGGAGGALVPRVGGFGAAGSFTAGLVTLIKGSTLYVTDFSGNTIKVTTPKGLQATKTVKTSVKGIRPGDSVVVRTTKQKDGSYRATSISVDNSGSGGFPGGNG